MTIAILGVGVPADDGILVVASDRPGFPTVIETLLLRSVANQATIAMQAAGVANLQQRVADEIERNVAERTAEITRSNRELREHERELRGLHEQLSDEFDGLARLHEVSNWWTVNAELQTVLEQVLDATIAMQKADFGNVQLYNPVLKALEIVAHRGFGEEFLAHFASVKTDEGAACSRALAGRERVLIEDVTVDPSFAPHREIAARAGYRAVQSTPLISRAGKLLGILSTHFRHPHRPSAHDLRLTDLYARQAAEIIDFRLAAGELRNLAALAENSSDFVAIASLEGVPQFVNAAGREIVGLDRAESVAARQMGDFVHEHDRERFEQEVLPALAQKGRWEGEIQFRSFRTDDPIPMLHHVFYIREGDPRLGIGTISRNITERKRSEDNLRRTQEELAHVTRVMSMGELTASIAHEVNQPLAAVITNGDACLRWLARDVPDLAEARSAVHRIISDARRASDVIGRIRSLCAKSTVEKIHLAVNDLIHESLALASAKVSSHRASVRLELSRELPVVLGDRVQLQQVLLNLIINGIEAMQQVRDRPRRLAIRTGRSNGDVLVAVSDSGIGLDPRTMSRLFDPFFTTKLDGMGLGLSISRRVVEDHGGRLWAEQNPEKGATFTVTLPPADDRMEA
jgi:PAS domain S-box-containing protein